MPPVAVKDERQEWFRRNAPRPRSVHNTSDFRVIMDGANKHFGQFYQIISKVRTMRTL